MYNNKGTASRAKGLADCQQSKGLGRIYGCGDNTDDNKG